MADKTNTATTWTKIPQYTHAPGVQMIVGKYGASISVSELVKCARLPGNCDILDYEVFHNGDVGKIALQLRKFSSSSSTTIQNLEATASASGVFRFFGSAGGSFPLHATVSAGMLNYVDFEVMNRSGTHSDTIAWKITFTSNRAG